MSKVLYCLQVISNSWGTDTRNETDARHNAFTKRNMLTLQMYQNKVLRLLTGNGYNVSTLELCNQGGFLSINQIVAHTTLMSIFKIKNSGEPKYLAERLGLRSGGTNLGLRNPHDIQIDFKKALEKERECSIVVVSYGTP